MLKFLSRTTLVFFFTIITNVAAKADCDYCASGPDGRNNCTISGTFAICGEAGRVTCGIGNPGKQITFGKCGAGILSTNNDDITIKDDKTHTTIIMNDSIVEKIKKELHIEK